MAVAPDALFDDADRAHHNRATVDDRRCSDGA